MSIIFIGLLFNLPEFVENQSRASNYPSKVLTPGEHDLYSACVVLLDVKYRMDPHISHDKLMPVLCMPQDKGAINLVKSNSQDNVYSAYINRDFSSLLDSGKTMYVYKSNIVGQRFIVYFMEKVMRLNRFCILQSLHVAFCFLMALCTTIVLMFFVKRCGIIPIFIFALLMSLGAPSYLMCGKHLYWAGWSLMAPIALSCVFCDSSFGKGRLTLGEKIWLCSIFIALLIKFVFYFELMTTVILAAFLPWILVCLEHKNQKKAVIHLLRLGVWFSVVVVSAFVSVMLLKLVLLAHDAGGMEQALSLTGNNIWDRMSDCSIVKDRGHWVTTDLSGGRSFFWAFVVIWCHEAFNLPPILQVGSGVFLLVHVVVSVVALLPNVRKRLTQGSVAMVILTWFAFIALSSWYFLAVPHVLFHHLHCSILLWIPYNLVIFASAVCVCRDLWKNTN